MAEIIYDDGVDLSLIQSKKIAITDYSSQGHTYTLNLEDSGVDVVVGLRLGSSSWAKAETVDFGAKDMAEAVAEGDIVSVLLSDQVQHYVYAEQIAPDPKEGATLLFARGFDIRYGCIEVPEDHNIVMVTPKDLGHKARKVYAQGKGTPDVVVVEVDTSDQAWDLVLSYAKTIGGIRAGAIKTVFTEEIETDLFGEQVVPCGGISHLTQAGSEILVEADYQPEIAYSKVCHETKQIIGLIDESDITEQRWSRFNTAECGDYVSGPRVINRSSKEAIEAVLTDIQDGTFARELITDQNNGALELKALYAEGEAHSIEKTGQRLHKTFGWTDPDEDYTEGNAVC